jgi:hypothetical protein
MSKESRNAGKELWDSEISEAIIWRGNCGAPRACSRISRNDLRTSTGGRVCLAWNRVRQAKSCSSFLSRSSNRRASTGFCYRRKNYCRAKGRRSLRKRSFRYCPELFKGNRSSRWSYSEFLHDATYVKRVRRECGFEELICIHKIFLGSCFP